MIPGRILDHLADAASLPRIDPSRCLRMRYSGSGCEKCAVVCPRSAIRLEETLGVQGERCVGCLTCTTFCPSGALEAEADFGRLTSGLAGHPFPVLVVACGKKSSTSHLELPCLGMLSAEHLVALYAKGNAVVHLDASACEGCEAGAMLPHLEARLRKTEEEAHPSLSGRIRLVRDAKELDFRREILDRRGFFQSFRRMAFQGMTTALASPAAERKTMPYREKHLPTRRAILLAALASFPSETAQWTGKAFSFSVTFGKSCDGCLGCVATCPTGALSESRVDGPEPSSPRFDPERCTGCGLCAEFCLSDAIRVERPGPAPCHAGSEMVR